jgi:hypothetical protein
VEYTKVIGISGAQGSGKTSLLAELAYRGWIVDDYKVSRAVQAELGWNNLYCLKESFETMVKFQELILTKKYIRDLKISEQPRRSSDIKGQAVLSERTFADVFAYTDHWVNDFVNSDTQKPDVQQMNNFIKQYCKTCIDCQTEVYFANLVLPLMDYISWENDKHRAGKNSATMIYNEIENFVHYTMDRHFTISTKTVTQRADEVEQYLQSLLN